MKSAQYINKICDMATSLVGPSMPENNIYFTDEYIKAVGNNCPSPSLLFVTYIMRMCGVNVCNFPNVPTVDKLKEFFEKKGQILTNAENRKDQGNIIVMTMKNAPVVGIVVETDEDKIQFVTATGVGMKTAVSLRSISDVSGFIQWVAKPDYSAPGKGIYKDTSLSLVRGVYVIQFKQWMSENYNIQFNAIDPSTRSDLRIGALQTMCKIMAKNRFLDPTVEIDSVSTLTADIQRSLLNMKITARTRGNMAKLLQYLLYAHGGGTFGKDGWTALQAFRDKRHLGDLDEMDIKTWHSLVCKW